MHYLVAAEGKKNDVANRITTDIIKFFNSIPHTSDATHLDIILHTPNLVEYIHTLKERNLAPSTIIDKLRNLQIFIEYLSTCTTTTSQVNIGSKCETTIKWLQKRSKILRKDVKMQQFSNALRGEHEVDSASNPREFWSNANVKREIDAILKKAKTRDVTNNDYLTVQAYLAAIIMYKNGQRPGVVENMTINEFKKRRDEGNGKVVIRVLNHKTCASTGPANIIINRKCEQLMSQYYDLMRSKIVAQSVALSKLFFLTSSGNAFKKISETIQKVAGAYNIIVPTASLHRKVTKTTAHCDEEIGEGKMRALNRHMSHSDATSSKFYQLPAAKTAVNAYNTIKHLSKKRFFTAQEDKFLTKEWPIDKGATPTLELCRRISEKYNMQRTAKQLQDRWLTLSKTPI